MELNLSRLGSLVVNCYKDTVIVLGPGIRTIFSFDQRDCAHKPILSHSK